MIDLILVATIVLILVWLIVPKREIKKVGFRDTVIEVRGGKFVDVEK